MMSSFRPSADLAVPSFVSVRLGLVRDAEGDFQPQEHGEPDEGPVVQAPAEPEPPSVEEIEAEAYARGVEAGRAELPWQEAERLGQLCEVLEGSLRSLAVVEEGSLRANRALVLELAAEIARSWVGREYTETPSCYAASLDRVLESNRDRNPVRLSLNDDDLAALCLVKGDPVERWTTELGLEIEVEAGLAGGEFHLDLDHAQVDGRNEAILRRLRDSLSTAIESGHNADPEEAE